MYSARASTRLYIILYKDIFTIGGNYSMQNMRNRERYNANGALSGDLHTTACPTYPTPSAIWTSATR